MNSFTEKAYAKINLYLDIESKRQDGYHDIISLMQNVSLCDIITITPNGSNEITIICSKKELEKDPQKNLVYRAAKLFFNELSSDDRGMVVEIEKNIPIAAGMAGGSADAAATLRCLNRMNGYPFSVEELCEMGKRLGADVPFCIVGGAYITRGIGDVLTETVGLPEEYILVTACGNDKISTPEAYKALDEKYDNFNKHVSGKGFSELLDLLKEKKLGKAVSFMYNIFEDVSAEIDSVNLIKRIMKESGALISMMSGSGPAVFGIFNNRENAQSAVENLIEVGIASSISRPIGKII